MDSHYISLAAQHSAVTVHQRGFGVSPDQSPHCMAGKAGIQKDEVSLKVYLVVYSHGLCVLLVGIGKETWEIWGAHRKMKVRQLLS